MLLLFLIISTSFTLIQTVTVRKYLGKAAYYVNCYGDRDSDPAMILMQTGYSDFSVMKNDCMALAQKRGYTVFALKGGDHSCYVSHENGFDKHGKRSSCGDDEDHLSVYYIGSKYEVTTPESEAMKLYCDDRDEYLTGLDAFYGLNGTDGCNMKAVAPTVTDMCLDKKSCSLDVTNEVFGDPCVGDKKELIVYHGCYIRSSSGFRFSFGNNSYLVAVGIGVAVVMIIIIRRRHRRDPNSCRICFGRRVIQQQQQQQVVVTNHQPYPPPVSTTQPQYNQNIPQYNYPTVNYNGASGQVAPQTGYSQPPPPVYPYAATGAVPSNNPVAPPYISNSSAPPDNLPPPPSYNDVTK